MCIQILDTPDAAPTIKATQVTLANPPYIPELPTILNTSARFELEAERLLEAELCLRAATRHVEMAKWAHLDAALQLAEQQVSLPLQKLLWADERHEEDTATGILNGDEQEAMAYFIGMVVKVRKERRFPSFDAEECDCLSRLMQKYSAAIEEKRDRCDDATSADDHDFWRVRQRMLEANTEPVRTAE